MSPVYEQIKTAILEKRQVIAIYNGLRREMCPHAIGLKKGREQALFIQFAGESNSGLGNPEDNWRCTPLAKLELLEIRDGEWHTAMNHSRRSTCLDWIDVEVTY
jgi:hypothetical protein